MFKSLNKIIQKNLSNYSIAKPGSKVIYEFNKELKETKFEPKFIKKFERLKYQENIYEEDFKKLLFKKEKKSEQNKEVEIDELYGNEFPPKKIFNKINGKDMFYQHKKFNLMKENFEFFN